MTAFEDLVADVLRLDAGAIRDELTMGDVETWTSLTHIELIVMLEENYGVQLSGDDIVEMTSIGGVRAALRRHGVASV